MSLRRVLIIAKPNISKILESYQIPLICVIGVLGSTFPVGWNGEKITLFQISLEMYGNSRDSAIILLLHELFSWTWAFLGIFYLLPKLLSPLGDSFLINQTLWLRFTPCLPTEVATARVIWVFSYGLWLGIFGFFWLSISTLFHHVFITQHFGYVHLPTVLFVDVLGLISNVLLSGGIVVTFNSFFLANYSATRLIATASLIAPSFLSIVNLAMNKFLDKKYSLFLPYAAPFSPLSEETFYHFGMASIIGICLLIFHVIAKLRYSVLENLEK